MGIWTNQRDPPSFWCWKTWWQICQISQLGIDYLKKKTILDWTIMVEWRRHFPETICFTFTWPCFQFTCNFFSWKSLQLCWMLHKLPGGYKYSYKVSIIWTNLVFNINFFFFFSINTLTSCANFVECNTLLVVITTLTKLCQHLTWI